MTWDPDGIDVTERFAEYVEKLRETASDSEKVHTDMNQTHTSGGYGGTA
ncbi:hypothetical protein [Halorubrum sp. SD626R]|nr:hypothetical protein [Halorubrum sp. SD626R]